MWENYGKWRNLIVGIYIKFSKKRQNVDAVKASDDSQGRELYIYYQSVFSSQLLGREYSGLLR